SCGARRIQQFVASTTRRARSVRLESAVSRIPQRWRWMMSEKRQRKIKNFLLDWRFQLKYSGAVVLVTVAVASVLGHFAYRYSVGQTRLLTAQMAGEPDLSRDAMSEIQQYAEAEDCKVLTRIVLGVATMA